MSKITLKIVGDHLMNCGGCEGKVQNALSQIPGVAEVSPDRNTQLVEVTLLSEPIGLEQLNAQLETIGYQAVLA